MVTRSGSVPGVASKSLASNTSSGADKHTPIVVTIFLTSERAR